MCLRLEPRAKERENSKSTNPWSKGILGLKPYSHSGTQLYPSQVGAMAQQ